AMVRTDAGTDPQLAAYVVPSTEERPNTRELRAHLRKTLPGYMVPTLFVVLDQLPLTPNGKVDRKALRAPEALAADDERAHTPPRTLTEEILADIWRDVLRVE